MFRSLISRRRGMPCTQEEDSRSTRTGMWAASAVSATRCTTLRGAEGMARSMRCTSWSATMRGRSSTDPVTGTPCIERFQSPGSSSTATTGTSPRMGDCCISRSAAAPLVPAPTTATRTPVLVYEFRRNANSRCWNRTMP